MLLVIVDTIQVVALPATHVCLIVWTVWMEVHVITVIIFTMSMDQTRALIALKIVQLVYINPHTVRQVVLVVNQTL